MKAIAQDRYGAPREVLEWRDVEVPDIGDDQVLIRVHAASVNIGDFVVVTGTPYLVRPVYGLARPRRPVIGQDVAGTVERVGDGVTRLAPGDAVFGGGFGTFAEFAVAPEKRLAIKPPSLSFEHAAALPIAGLTALQGIRDVGGVEQGERVLINGASGGVGTYAVQVAKALGAEVTAVCSTRNVDQARHLGADTVIDYTKEDFTRDPQPYDVVFDNAASRSLSETRAILKRGGVLVPNAGQTDSKWLASLPRMFGAVITAPFSGTRSRLNTQAWRPEDLTTLAEMVVEGRISPFVERTYSLVEAPEALTYMGEGHVRGKLVLTV